MKKLNVICAAVAASALGAPAHATYYHFDFGYYISEEHCGTLGNDCAILSYSFTGQINTDDDGNGVDYFAPTDGELIFYEQFSNLHYLQFYYDPATLATVNTRLPSLGYAILDDCGPRCNVLLTKMYYLAGYKSDAPTGPLGVTLGTGFPPAVPEPSCWMLMVGGFGMVGGAMRSRRKVAVRFA